MKPIRVIPIIFTVYCIVSILPSQNVIASEAKQSEKPKTSAVIPACPESNRAFYHHPWLESSYHSEMQGPLSPNQGTDDYEILFHTTGPYSESYLGARLCLAGDQNGDGYDDIIAYCDDPPEVRLYFGGNPMDTIPDVIFPTQPGWGGLFPTELADLNGDGDIDIVHGWEPNSQYQEVYVYYGGALLDTIKDLTLV